MPTPLEIFVTGGTGYIGQHLIPALLARGHRVRALARQESLNRVPAGATTVVGDALQVDSVTAAIRPGDTVVHLVGTPHPTPSKADQFEKVDLASIRATVRGEASGNFSSDLPECRSAGADHAGLSMGARARRVDNS